MVLIKKKKKKYYKQHWFSEEESVTARCVITLNHASMHRDIKETGSKRAKPETPTGLLVPHSKQTQMLKPP